MMVLNKKPLEKNRNLLGKKSRKLSNEKQSQQSYSIQRFQSSPEPPNPVSPVYCETPVGDLFHQTQSLPDNGEVRDVTGLKDAKGSVSMESMVSLTSHKLQQLFSRGVKLLKCQQLREALSCLEMLVKEVEDGPSYGEYVIYRRTRNKKTTLSALHMFLALAWEGMARPRKAIECCNKAINEDPGWPIPFSKRSEYFACLEQFYLDTDGAGREEIIRARLGAQIIVNSEYGGDEQGGGDCRVFGDLQEALDAASEGDTIFLEKGFYYREEGFVVQRRCSIIGASSRGCILVSKGNPTMQIFGCMERGGGEILLQRLQFQNKCQGLGGKEEENERMKSSTAHLYIISPESVTIRECLFLGGEERTGGLLVAEEAFYRSLLDLEFQNPEMLTACSGGEKCLRLLVDFCIFSDCHTNCSINTNNQATAVISNSFIYNCGYSGLRAEEGCTINFLNSEVRNCHQNCLEVDTLSSVNIRGSLLSHSADKTFKPASSTTTTARDPTSPSGYLAGLNLMGKSKANVSRSLLRNHLSAVSVHDSDLVFEENCVMEVTSDQEEAFSDQGLQLQHSAIFVRLGGTVVVQRNNFHNCNLVFLVQQGASPTISNNNVETCLIGFIVGARAQPRIEDNIFQCILMSIGMFIEDSAGCVSRNLFQYVANGLSVYQGSGPLLARNNFVNISVPGLSAGSLNFDIQKVNSGKTEGMTGSEVITFTAETDQKMAATAVLRRKQAATGKLRSCSNCGSSSPCSFSCIVCRQITYCSEICRAQDQRRHRAFCALTLKDMF